MTNTSPALFSLLVFSLLAIPAFAQDSATAPASSDSFFGAISDDTVAVAPSSGQALLDECAARIPRENMEMSGRITMRRMYGIEIKELDYNVKLFWREVPPNATYILKDLKGVEVERLHTTRQRDGKLIIARFLGTAQTPAPAPAVNESVQGTDITWLDVSMDFVWWKNPTLAGTGKFKGRFCDILEVEPREPLPGCAKARLWVDREHKVVVQAFHVNEAGKDARRMWVRSVQKVEGRWVLKDIEVETVGAKHRTRLNVKDFKIMVPEDEKK